MMNARILRLTFGTFALYALIACGNTGPCDAGVSAECPEPDHPGVRLIEGKRFLSNFEGQRARDVFKQIDSEYRQHNDDNPHCEATYGVVLADAQVLVKNLNGLVLRALTTSSAAPSGDFTAASAPLDLGVFLDNGWTAFEPVLAELSNYADTVTSIPNCTFTIGAGDPAETFADGEDNPFKFVLNFGDSKLPLVQLVLTGRFDGAEARLINALAQSTLGSMDLVLAHDYSLTFNLPKILHQLGLPSQCLRENVFQCAVLDSEAAAVNRNLLGWSFLFADNPKLLSKSETRWDKRFSYADNEFAGAFYGLRSLLGALKTRSNSLADSLDPYKEHRKYILVYDDVNSNGETGFGINITAIKLSPEFLITETRMEDTEEGRVRAKELRKEYEQAEAFLHLGLETLGSGELKISDASISEIDLFIERVHSNMRAVDVPGTQAERIPIDSFNTVVQESLPGLFDGTPMPNFLELDLQSYFVQPKPWRKFLPYWEMTTDATVNVGSRFLADSDHYNTVDGYHTLPEILFTDLYGNIIDASSVIERDLLGGIYDGGTEFGPALTDIGSPSDCVNAKNIFSAVIVDGKSVIKHWPVMMIGLQDASLNGVLYTDLRAWTPVYNSTGGNGTAGDCPNPSGFQPASNYSLTKSTWMVLDFLVDHFELTQFLAH